MIFIPYLKYSVLCSAALDMEVKCPLQRYSECNPSQSDLEKRSKGGTSQQDNAILEQLKVRLQDLVRIDLWVFAKLYLRQSNPRVFKR